MQKKQRKNVPKIVPNKNTNQIDSGKMKKIRKKRKIETFNREDIYFQKTCAVKRCQNFSQFLRKHL